MKIRRIDFSPDEWLAGTGGLSDRERGIYITACALIYSHDGPIPETELRRWCDSRSRDYAAALARLTELGKLTRNGPEISQNRAIKELELAHKRARIATEKGQRGGRPRKENNNIEKAGVLSPPNLTINHQPSTIKTPQKAPTSKLREDFETWWQIYPHKVGKGAAENKFVIARRSATLVVLMDAVARYIEAKPPEREWVNPAVWLHQKRWLDEPAPAILPKVNGAQVVLPGLTTTARDVWIRRLTDYKKSKFWMPSWGFPPDDPDCYAPASLLEEMGFHVAS